MINPRDSSVPVAGARGWSLRLRSPGTVYARQPVGSAEPPARGTGAEERGCHHALAEAAGIRSGRTAAQAEGLSAGHEDMTLSITSREGLFSRAPPHAGHGDGV